VERTLRGGPAPGGLLFVRTEAVRRESVRAGTAPPTGTELIRAARGRPSPVVPPPQRRPPGRSGKAAAADSRPTRGRVPPGIVRIPTDSHSTRRRVPPEPSGALLRPAGAGLYGAMAAEQHQRRRNQEGSCSHDHDHDHEHECPDTEAGPGLRSDLRGRARAPPHVLRRCRGRGRGRGRGRADGGSPARGGQVHPRRARASIARSKLTSRRISAL
jgi:hypothetical protein